jgi:hypothetical protein
VHSSARTAARFHDPFDIRKDGNNDNEGYNAGSFMLLIEGDDRVDRISDRRGCNSFDIINKDRLV